MRISAITATFLILSLSSPIFLSDAASAQSVSKKGKKKVQRGEGKRSGEEDLDAPVNTSKFPGVGSIDSWKTSVPEYRAGMAKMKAHSWDEAIAHFRASIALYEYQPKAFYEIGRAIERKGGLVADAEKSYRKSVKLDNQFWQGWKALSNVLYEQKRYDEAREAVGNALNLDPPRQAKMQMDKMVQMMDAASRDANTRGQNTAQ